jgi:hypothetical protein
MQINNYNSAHLYFIKIKLLLRNKHVTSQNRSKTVHDGSCAQPGLRVANFVIKNL